jgi:hypothetical protein
MYDQYVELTRDSYPFKAGTQFKVTHSDDGFWSRYAFYAGKVMLKGKERQISAESNACKLIYGEEYTGKVIEDKRKWLFPSDDY